MAWENRQTGRYYYRKQRVGRKVHSEYIGAGVQAELIARLDAIQRQQAEDARQDDKQHMKQEKAIDAQIEALAKLADEVVTALLIVADYHLHKRQWRKRRGKHGSNHQS